LIEKNHSHINLVFGENFGRGKLIEALSGLDDGVEDLGSFVTLQILATDLDVTAQNYDAALASLDQMIMQCKRPEIWYASRGEIFMLARKPRKALRSFYAAQHAIHDLPERDQKSKFIQILDHYLKLTIRKINETRYGKYCLLE